VKGGGGNDTCWLDHGLYGDWGKGVCVCVCVCVCVSVRVCVRSRKHVLRPLCESGRDGTRTTPIPPCRTATQHTEARCAIRKHVVCKLRVHGVRGGAGMKCRGRGNRSGGGGSGGVPKEARQTHDTPVKALRRQRCRPQPLREVLHALRALVAWEVRSHQLPQHPAVRVPPAHEADAQRGPHLRRPETDTGSVTAEGAKRRPCSWHPAPRATNPKLIEVNERWGRGCTTE
jgi:hypothetical protein